MKNIMIFCSLLVVAFASCSQDDVPSAKLKVTLDKNEYYVGDTVTFWLDGEPDNIVFYSGEDGHNYALKDRVYADNDLLVNFTSFVRTGIYKNLQFLVSNNFNGSYDTENVNAATWQDLSDKVAFSEGADYFPSGEINLKSYASDDNDEYIYVAFRYSGLEISQQNTWVIRAITVNKVSPEGTSAELGKMSTMGWKAVDFSNTNTGWTITSAQLLMDGKKEPGNDDWVISKGFKIKESVADTGVALKNISTQMTKYQYIYEKAGTYKAVFDTSSNWYSGTKQSLTEVVIEIKEQQ